MGNWTTQTGFIKTSAHLIPFYTLLARYERPFPFQGPVPFGALSSAIPQLGKVTDMATQCYSILCQKTKHIGL